MSKLIGSVLLLQCIFLTCMSNATSWILQQNLPAEEVAQVTSREQEHQLLLKHLSRKNKGDLGMDILIELFAKITDGDFYAIISDESKRKEQDSVVKAALATFMKIPYQDKIFQLLNRVAREAASHFQRHKNLEEAMTFAYTKIDKELQNLTLYDSLKREYQNNASSVASSYKVYHYGIPKTDDDLRKIFVELANHPNMKKLGQYTSFQFYLTREDIVLRQSLVHLVNMTGKLDKIQQIYDESLLEVFPQIKDISVQDVDLKMPLNLNFKDLKPIMAENMVTKIKKDPDLKTDFESAEKRVRELWTNN